MFAANSPHNRGGHKSRTTPRACPRESGGRCHQSLPLRAAGKSDPSLRWGRLYAEMAAHYDTAILPARPRRPRDKAKSLPQRRLGSKSRC